MAPQISEDFLQKTASATSLYVDMNTDIKILMEFLQRLGPEVSGREVAEPQSEAAVRLERFARGECNEDERAEVCRLLRLHPIWLRWLADRVKLARVTTVAH